MVVWKIIELIWREICIFWYGFGVEKWEKYGINKFLVGVFKIVNYKEKFKLCYLFKVYCVINKNVIVGGFSKI